MIAKMIPGSHPLNKYHRFIILRQKKRIEKTNKCRCYSTNPRNNKSSKTVSQLTLQEKKFLEMFNESIAMLSRKNVIATINIEENLYGIDE